MFELKLYDLIQGANARAIQIAAWSFAVLGKGQERFWGIIQNQILKLKDSFTPQDLTICIWALAKARAGTPEIYNELFYSSRKNAFKFQ